MVNLTTIHNFLSRCYEMLRDVKTLSNYLKMLSRLMRKYFAFVAFEPITPS